MYQYKWHLVKTGALNSYSFNFKRLRFIQNLIQKKIVSCVYEQKSTSQNKNHGWLEGFFIKFIFFRSKTFKNQICLVKHIF